MRVRITMANHDDALFANELLTMLIRDEKSYDNNINQNCVVKSLYEKFYENDDVCLLVAKEKKQIVGYLYGFMMDCGDSVINRVAQLDAVFVLEKYRGQGVARNLIDKFKDWALKKQAKYLELKVCNGNQTAINLYKEAGFKSTKIIMSLPLEEQDNTL